MLAMGTCTDVQASVAFYSMNHPMGPSPNIHQRDLLDYPRNQTARNDRFID